MKLEYYLYDKKDNEMLIKRNNIISIGPIGFYYGRSVSNNR